MDENAGSSPVCVTNQSSNQMENQMENQLSDSQITYPCVMEVSDYSDFKKPLIRVVFMKKNEYYIAWENAETIEESMEVYNCSPWDYARPMIKKITRQEILDAFNCEDFEVID